MRAKSMTVRDWLETGSLCPVFLRRDRLGHNGGSCTKYLEVKGFYKVGGQAWLVTSGGHYMPDLNTWLYTPEL